MSQNAHKATDAITLRAESMKVMQKGTGLLQNPATYRQNACGDWSKCRGPIANGLLATARIHSRWADQKEKMWAEPSNTGTRQ